MNDRYDAGAAGYGADQYELVGYDEYGRPVYRQVPAQQPYDPYAQQQGYGYDPYDTGRQQPVPPYDPYGTGQQPPVPPYDTGHDPYGRTAAGGQQPRVAEQTAYIPQQARPEQRQDPFGDTRGAGGGHEDRDYRTEQFAFVEEPDQDSEDVIDWLKFTENRTERREEAKRRARSRLVALVVVLALVAAGGVGYLWYAGKLPGVSGSEDTKGGTTSAAAQQRDVIVVHLHDTKKGGTTTALLVDNTTTEQGTTVLLPNSLALSGDDGTTTLAKSVEDDGSSGTREALDTVLGTSIQGTWRLDTPYLQNLVDLVGNIEVDTDTDVPDPAAKKKGEAPLVSKGERQTLSGKMAVAYATYRAQGEAQNAQLERFGQVMQGVLRKMSSDPQAATTTVQTLAQILDPSLTDKDLGTFLAKLSDLAKSGDHKTALLPVQDDGTLSAEASDSVVKDVLGGTAKSPDQDAAVRVSVQNASGVKDNTEKARVVLLNGGFTFLEAGTASGAQPASKVTYADAADKENATEVAKTLGLPDSAVTKGEVSSNANVSVILGQDYEPASAG
ncbi:LCP family protein [Streptomyces chromofuscus]|uniref:LytR C-terminal domain-containing protein n=1 Tax=Streptomyces chromofuscus TaxID=42881 RepID=A0A7M2TF95_STRCW|nr:LCP family protein [Streptomyces chromofuscus]QOV46623.1 LytR C-terminal domain-containing protein [Streptomyces chromofuscus]GGT08248.1 membrane protein [Streptomyces chromofuscus]